MAGVSAEVHSVTSNLAEASVLRSKRLEMTQIRGILACAQIRGFRLCTFAAGLWNTYQLSKYSSAVCACLATGVCVGSVTLELWVMRGTCSWSALLLQISETSTLHWLQSAHVSWLGLCGPETSPWSAGTSLLASIECHADDRQTLFHPFHPPSPKPPQHPPPLQFTTARVQ